MTSTHLQGLGQVEAKPAAEFSVGEKMLWNFGGTSKVLGVAKETDHFVTYDMVSDSGLRHERRLKKNRLVGVAA